MVPKTLLSVRLPVQISNRLQNDADAQGMSLSSYVRWRLSQDIHDRDLIGQIQTVVDQHDARIVESLGLLLDKYTQPAEITS